MSISNNHISVANIDVEVVRKDIKNLHLGVYPPEGRVRMSVPLNVTDDNIRLAVVSRLDWIKKQKADFINQPRQSQREYVSGESHYFQGRSYRLKVEERIGRPSVTLKQNNMVLIVRPESTPRVREAVLNQWYRHHLKQVVPVLLTKWEPLVGCQSSFWGVKKMKTKWGSCNTEAARIWLNLELAKKSPECLEYIIVHELTHIRERQHNDAFKARMDKVMPKWRLYRDILKSEPLAHEDWQY